MIDSLQVRVGRVAGCAHAADRALEQRVAGEDVARRRGTRASRWCGPACGAPRSAARRPRRRRRARSCRSRPRPASRSPGWMSTSASGWRSEHLVELAHVVVVVVGEQDVGQGQPALVDRLQQRRDRAAGVDHHRRAAVLVGDEVRVGQELLGHGALEDHGRDATRVALQGARKRRIRFRTASTTNTSPATPIGATPAGRPSNPSPSPRVCGPRRGIGAGRSAAAFPLADRT